MAWLALCHPPTHGQTPGGARCASPAFGC
jgi:hypothetical protein